MKTMNTFKRTFLLLLLMFIGIQNIAAVIATYKYDADIEVGEVKYRCYTVTAPIGTTGNTHTLGHFARVLSLRYVTTAECVIPATVENGGITYQVEGISRELDTNNHVIETLKFTRSVGTTNDSYKNTSGYYAVFVHGIEGEDLGVDFSHMYLPYLKTLVVRNFIHTGTVDEWKFDSEHFPKLEDVYVTDGCPTLSYGMFVRASKITMHIPSRYIRESMQTAAVWSDFKAIVPFSWTYYLTVKNYSNNYVKVYSLGNDDYSSTTHLSSPLYAGKDYDYHDVKVNLEENYLVTFQYDPEKQDVPTVTRNDEPLDPNDLIAVEDGLVGYQESNVLKNVSFHVNANYKHCRLSFNTGSDSYIAGTYEIRRNGSKRTGNITDGFVDCDYGTQVKLTMPATPYLLNNNLRLDKIGSTVTSETLTLPVPVDGVYTITFNVPSTNAARFNYAYVVPSEEVVDPVITVMRMGEGEVKLTKFWDWDEQMDDYHNEQTINCLNPSTSIVIPLPSDEGWGYKLEVTPLKGQQLRNLLVGYIMRGDNDAPDKIYWGDYLDWISYNTSTNTYTFTVDMMEGGGDEFGMEDYNILVDMGPTETIVEEGSKQSIVCKGSTESTVKFIGKEVTELTGDCAAIVIMDDKGEFDHFVNINLAHGEKFTAFRDGVDVTNEFEGSQGVYMYEFVNDSYLIASGWTIIFEKDEAVVTGYDWKVVGQSLPENTRLTIIYEDEEEVHVLASGANDIHINASGLQGARFDIPWVEDASPQIACDGQDRIADLSLSGNTYSLSVPAIQILDALWLVGMQNNQTQWTALRNENTIGAEFIVTRGEKADTLTCASSITSVSIVSASSAELRILTKVGSNFDIYLTGVSNSIAVIKVVREITGLGLKDAKDLVEAAKTSPQLLKADVSLEEVMDIQHKIVIAGGTVGVELKDATGTIPLKVLRDGVNVTSEGTLDGDFLCFSASNNDLIGTTWVITTDEAYDRYDVNRDGQISIADVTKLVNKILGKE